MDFDHFFKYFQNVENISIYNIKHVLNFEMFFQNGIGLTLI